MKKNINTSVTIATNKKARFNYFILDELTAGIVLTGTEIKSIRERKVNINEAYCFFKNNELFIKQMHIAQYKFGNIYNHEELRYRKLLLNKKELIKLKNNLEIGQSIIPLELFINNKGFAKIIIALVKGKKLYDKRKAIKEKDIQRRINSYDFDDE